MVYYEKGYIRHYQRNDRKNNRVIKSVEVRGIKNTTKFKDNESIILISEKEFNNLTSELKEMQETKDKLTNELNNIDVNTNFETKEVYNKLFDLMEIINNRNELLLNANDKLNNMVDVIIMELVKEFNNIIDANNKEVKERLETFINSVFDKANDTQTRQFNLINSECENIENQLTDINRELNNLSLWYLLRHRKDFNITVNLEGLKEVNNINVNYNDFDVNLICDKIFKLPDFRGLDHVKIKKNMLSGIDFSGLYIKFDNDF